MAAPATSQQRALSQRIREDPEFFVRDILGDTGVWKMQVDILESVRDHPHTSVASCHGPGKTFIAARVVLWFLFAFHRSLVLSTAPGNRQVRELLWKEIRAAHARSRVPLGGRLLTQRLELGTDWYALGFTAPEWDPTRFSGYHAPAVLAVVDEAASVPDTVADELEGVLSSGHCRRLDIGNPTNPHGFFCRNMKAANVRKIRIAAWDTPNFSAFGINESDIADGTYRDKIGGRPLPRPELTSPHWARERYLKWGPHSPLYLAKVAARFPRSSLYDLIPVDLVDAAQARDLKPDPDEEVEVAVDVARYGPDESVIGARKGKRGRLVKTLPKCSTTELAGEVIIAMRQLRAARAKIDVVGIGSGVVDIVREAGFEVLEMNAGASPADDERFLLARDEWFWHLRDLHESGDIDLDPDEESLAQLTSIRWKPDSRGRHRVESKEERRARMVKEGIESCGMDRADMWAMLFAESNTAVIV